MKRFNKHIVEALGLALIAAGYLSFTLSPFGGRDLSCPPFPSSFQGGCPLPPGSLFIAGIGLAIAGIILLVLATQLKPETGTDSNSRL